MGSVVSFTSKPVVDDVASSVVSEEDWQYIMVGPVLQIPDMSGSSWSCTGTAIDNCDAIHPATTLPDSPETQLNMSMTGKWKI